jgi:hypothetical protein
MPQKTAQHWRKRKSPAQLRRDKARMCEYVKKNCQVVKIKRGVQIYLVKDSVNPLRVPEVNVD